MLCYVLDSGFVPSTLSMDSSNMPHANYRHRSFSFWLALCWHANYSKAVPKSTTCYTLYVISLSLSLSVYIYIYIYAYKCQPGGSASVSAGRTLAAWPTTTGIRLQHPVVLLFLVGRGTM